MAEATGSRGQIRQASAQAILSATSHGPAVELNEHDVHAASSSRLRSRINSCRANRTYAVRAFSSNKAGKIRSGTLVIQASAAASLAARRKLALTAAVAAPASSLRSNRSFSRSNSFSAVARKGAAGNGRTSNRVSGSNRALNFRFIVFICFRFALFRPETVGAFGFNKKPAIDWQSRVFRNLLVSVTNHHPRSQKAETCAAKWTCIH